MQGSPANAEKKEEKKIFQSLENVDGTAGTAPYRVTVSPGCGAETRTLNCTAVHLPGESLGSLE